MKEIVLVGNPNTGKTTLFNLLTKSHEHTGNWHGVTVDSTKKIVQIENEKFCFVDLPGLYSLTPNSFEEQVSVDYILSHQADLFINVCNKKTLKHNLNLTLDLLMLGVDVVMVLNDFGDKHNQIIYLDKLKDMLGINIILNKNNKLLLTEFKRVLINNEFKINNNYLINNNKVNNIFNKLNNKKIKENQLKFYIDKCLCNADYYIDLLNKYNIKIDNDNNNYFDEFWIRRNELLNNISSVCLSKITLKTKCNFIDNILLNRFFCIPIFLAIMTFVFYITFILVGPIVSNWLKNLIQVNLGSMVDNFANSYISVVWIKDLLSIAVVDGLGSVISFLPQVMFLFMFLQLLEDSGYISRLAFCFDEIFEKVGLSGKSVYTLLMGFGCSTTACITSRNMSDKNAKIKTAMITPFMSCSAKLPVYMVIGAGFFGSGKISIIMLLYLLGVIVALMLSYFFEKTYLPSKQQSFLFEFSSLQIPKTKNILKTCIMSAKMFVVRIATVVFALNIIIWVLSNFAFDFSYVLQSGNDSMLKSIAKVICFLFAPLGFGTWGATIAVLSGIVAKEMIVSTISMLNAPILVGGISLSESLSVTQSAVWFTPASALSFMVFCLLYCPCVACFSALRKEIGKKWTYICVVLQFAIAYICAMLCNLFCSLMNVFGAITVLVFVVIGFIVLSRLLKKRKKCVNCSYCVKKCE